ncbi:MAG: hypothetical protein HY791_15485, partial [Deltaproteobacteria bacterium]|nr:hypothetical protein [Deltaproteobacteria bacterium]
MRPIRENTPHKTWFVTSRTLESRFFLKPDPEAVEVMGFVLARALRRFPSIRLRAYVFLSNHLHLVLTDERGELSAFCQQLFGNLARETNELRGREGTVFPRRFSAEEIVDDEAFADRVVYTLLNPA